MIYRYPKEVHDFVKAHCDGVRDGPLAEMTNEALGTKFTKSSMHSFRNNHGYRNNLGKLTREEVIERRYPPGMMDWIRGNSRGVGSKELAEAVNARFGTAFTPVKMKMFCQRHGIRRGVSGWFQKGHAPANKGRRQSEYCTPEAMERSRATQFKKGNVPWDKAPVGTVSVTAEGRVLKKVSDDGAQWDRWKCVSRLAWEESNGPIPEGMCVIHKDGDSRNNDTGNLALVTRSELLQLSKGGYRHGGPDVTDAALSMIRLKGRAREIRKGRNARRGAQDAPESIGTVNAANHAPMEPKAEDGAQEGDERHDGGGVQGGDKGPDGGTVPDDATVLPTGGTG